MLSIFIKAFSKHVWLRVLVFSLVLSSIGSGLTYIVVFSELLRLNASASSLAMTFMLSLAPGLIGSYVGIFLLKKIGPKFCFIAAEVIAAMGLAIPVLGVLNSSIELLQCSSTFASIALGISMPTINHYTKHFLSEDEIAASALIDTFVFASHVLIGVGLGVILYDVVSSLVMLLINFASYIAAIFCLLRLPSVKVEVGYDSVKKLPSELTLVQKKSLSLLPALTAVGSPAMALLPTLLMQTANRTETVLMLLFARSLGQLCGPLLIKESRLKAKSNWTILICLLGFVLLYQAIGWFDQPLVLFSVVFFAHLLSNIIFSLGWYGILKNFPPDYVAAASANSYRKQIGVGVVFSMAAGLVADHVGGQYSIMILSGIGFLGAVYLIFNVSTESVPETDESLSN
ncbi:Uncharacterized protein ChrSV_0772 [Chromobacterium vaccinii]|nr:Uncharacterized protein ChrSW_0772 [Chromobacterium vaccinii]QND88231.1 Uncharacterized protein ChrSV_0772 [Chromobacterium vaccinii]